MKERFASLLLLIAVLVSVSAPAWVAAQGNDTGGQVVVDSGFRPKPNGFSFENWGGTDHPASKLTPADAEYLFGEQVCARRDDDACVPTPGAQMWIDEMNKSTEGGHCEGMAALSAAFYLKDEKPDDFGAGQAFDLTPKDGVLLRTISTYYSTQALEPVQSATGATRQWSLQQIVDHLVTTLKSGSDYPTLGIYDEGGGHAVTPYKITSNGKGVYRVFIYDNNYPGAEKFIDVDVPQDAWIYSGAALNPKEDAAAWQGGAGSMDVTLLSQRYEPLQCPFCGTQTGPGKTPGSNPPKPTPPKPTPPKPTPTQPNSTRAPVPPNRPTRAPASAPNGYTMYTPSPCSQVQAVGRNSKQSLRMGTKGVENQIKGASMQPMRGTRGCFVRLPNDQQYDVRLVDQAGAPTPAATRPSTPAGRQPTTQLTVFTPGKVYSVSDVALRPGVAESFSFSPGDFSYQAGAKQNPTLRVASGGEGPNGYYEVSGFALSAGREFGARDTDDGRVAFNNDDPEIDDFDIRAEVVDEDDSKSYEFDDVDVGDNGQALIAVEEDGELDMDIDSDSDNQSDEADNDDDNDGTADSADQDDDNDGLADAEDKAYDTDADAADAAAEDDGFNADDTDPNEADDAADKDDGDEADDTADEADEDAADGPGEKSAQVDDSDDEAGADESDADAQNADEADDDSDKSSLAAGGPDDEDSTDEADESEADDEAGSDDEADAADDAEAEEGEDDAQ